MVLGRLPAHVDRVWFAAVCPQWRAAARQGGLPPPMPLLLLPDATVYSLPGRGPFHFPSCAGYTDTCGDWLVFSGEDGCFLKNPFSNATVMLPPLSRIRFQHVGGESVNVVAAEQNCFEVYEANFEQSRWAKVTTLGDDHVLFLCQRWCRSVSISYNEMPGDRIFFMDTDEEYYLCYSKEASSSCRVYDMRDGKVSTPLPLMSWKLGKVFATWLLPPGLN
nr:unnamed protein product [Digitaria exilis]